MFRMYKSVSGESMALRVIDKVIPRLKFFYMQNYPLKFLLGKLLFSAHIQLQSDYACTAWYTDLIEKLN